MTNEILSIVLCFVSGVVVASIVMIILEIRNKINGLQQQINIVSSLQKDIEILFREQNDNRLTIDEKIAKWSSEMYHYVDRNFNEINQDRREVANGIYNDLSVTKDQLSREAAELYRYIDSRLDKLNNKFTESIVSK